MSLLSTDFEETLVVTGLNVNVVPIRMTGGPRIFRSEFTPLSLKIIVGTWCQYITDEIAKLNLDHLTEANVLRIATHWISKDYKGLFTCTRVENGWDVLARLTKYSLPMGVKIRY